ncbi:esterase-like activity of phytase family protein [Microvirga sp. GCM10011540]|uniref:esterase-like activity of phytase family protein n=1 Tax=Microvirga sp. GCM10011540 TaxID=3317338 RepID=UPI0036190B36
MERGRPVPVPEELKDLPGNRGLEAIGIAPPRSPLSGAIVAVAERAARGDEAPTRGFILTGPRQGAFEVVRSNGYEIADLAFLPDGDMLLLDRRFSLLGAFSIRLRRVARDAIRPGALVDGPVIFESDASLQIDNMEGLSVHREGGETILTLISDDNFSPFQRTILLEFALVG